MSVSKRDRRTAFLRLKHSNKSKVMNEQKNQQAQPASTENEVRVSNQQGRTPAPEVLAMLENRKQYRVSEVTGMYVQVFEELEAITSKIIAIREYETGRDISNEELEKTTEALGGARGYVQERITESVCENIWAKNVEEI